MYVDKILSGIKAVQTLSRLNRAHPLKTDTFVLDFMNDADTITMAFADYYRTTVLSEETDPNKLHDLKATLDGYQVYNNVQIDELVRRFLDGEDRDKLDPILDACVGVYNEELDEDGQVDFKGKAKAFNRTYQFLASILPYTNAEWEKLSIFLNFLVPKLPAPVEQDLSKGILESIDMDSYRAEVQQTIKLTLPDEDASIYPLPTSGRGRVAEPQLDYLSNIIKSFNDRFGNIEWEDADRIRQVITEEIPSKVAADKAYQNAMKHSDKAAARLEHDRALQKVVISMLADHTELFKQFSDNPSFKRWLSDTIFGATYEEADFSPNALLARLMQQAEQFISRQFGSDPRWIKVNQAIWEFFRKHQGQRLGLAAISELAAGQSVSINDFLSILSLLTGPDKAFIQRIYYRRAPSGEETHVPASEVAEQTRRWVYDREVGESQWRGWASDVMVGWAPVDSLVDSHRLH